MPGKTIKQIADELGIDKQRVYRFIKRNHIQEAYHNSQSLFYDEEAQELIRRSLTEGLPVYMILKEREPSSPQEALTTNIGGQVGAMVEALVGMLQKELTIKNQQIDSLNALVSEAARLLKEQEQKKGGSSGAARRKKASAPDAEADEPAAAQEPPYGTEPEAGPGGDGAALPRPEKPSDDPPDPLQHDAMSADADLFDLSDVKMKIDTASADSEPPDAPQGAAGDVGAPVVPEPDLAARAQADPEPAPQEEAAPQAEADPDGASPPEPQPEESAAEPESAADPEPESAPAPNAEADPFGDTANPIDLEELEDSSAHAEEPVQKKQKKGLFRRLFG